MVEEWVYSRPDFKAQLKVISQPATKLRSPLRQGLKLDLMYEGDANIAWMIHYALLDADENLLPEGTVCESEVKAYFRVVNPELRVKVHRQRIKIGTQFYVVIGPHKVAQGVVSEVLRLLDKD